MVKWKEIQNTNFSISNEGVIKNTITGWIKKPRKDKYGYLRVSGYDLSKHKKVDLYPHKLVAKLFIDNPYNYPVVNHIDGDKENNNESNLEWTSHINNLKHRFFVLLNVGNKDNMPRGVYFNKEKQKWQVSIKHHEKTIYVGRYNNKQDAYKAYYYKFIEIKGYSPWDENMHRVFSSENEIIKYIPSDGIKEKRIREYGGNK